MFCLSQSTSGRTSGRYCYIVKYKEIPEELFRISKTRNSCMQFLYMQSYQNGTFFIKNALEKNRWQALDIFSP